MSFFETQYSLLAPKIYRYLAVRTGDRYLAEDLTSEVFLKSLQYEKDFQSGKKIMGPYLFRMAHNSLVDHFRKHQKEVLTDDLPEVYSPEDLTQKTHEKMVFERVEKILQGFAPQERDIVLLKIVSGMTFGEIANALDLNENTIKTQYFRTLDKLKQHPELLLYILIVCQS